MQKYEYMNDLNRNFEKTMKFCTQNWHCQCHYTACCKITWYM